MSAYYFPHSALTVLNINLTENFYSKIGFAIEEDRYSQEKKKIELLEKDNYKQFRNK